MKNENENEVEGDQSKSDTGSTSKKASKERLLFRETSCSSCEKRTLNNYRTL